jgi:hypothetical protein
MIKVKVHHVKKGSQKKNRDRNHRSFTTRILRDIWITVGSNNL